MNSMEVSERIKTVSVLISLIILSVSFAASSTATPYPGLRGDAEDTIKLSLDFQKPLIEEKDFTTVDLGGLPQMAEEGPALPFKPVKVLLPPGTSFSGFDVHTGEKATVSIGKPLKAAPNYSIIGNDQEPIAGGAYVGPIMKFPGKICEYRGTHLLHGGKIAMFTVHPVTYDTTTDSITFFRSIDLEVHTSTSSGSSIGQVHHPQELMSQVSNPEEIDNYESTDEEYASTDMLSGNYEYVIITADSLAPEFQSLLDWKENRSSFNAGLTDITGRVVTTEWITSQQEYWGDPASHEGKGNDTQTQVRNFIIDAYQTWSAEYILLGGDHEVIPCRYVRVSITNGPSSYIPADAYYAGLDGDWDDDDDGIYGEDDNAGAMGEEADLLFEVDVGRAPVSNTDEVTNFVNKVIAYEQTRSDPYLNSSLLVGEKLDDWPTWGGDYKDEVQDMTFPSQNPELTIQKLYAREGTFSANAFLNAMDEGVHLVNHMGHGNEHSFAGLASDDIESLSNSQYFLFFSQACLIGAFDEGGSSDSIAESLVTTEHGAVAALVNSREGWYQQGGTNGPSQQYDIQFFDALFQENIRGVGTALSDAKMDLVSHLGSDGGYMRWCFMTLNLLGDPETSVHFLEEKVHDVAVTDLNIQPPSKGDTSDITAQVDNEGEVSENDVPVELYVDGDKRDTKYVDVSSGGSTSVQFTWTPSQAKPYELKVQTNLSTDTWNENDFVDKEVEVVWRIDSPETIEDSTFQQRASIIIEETGSLYIDNSTVEVDGTWREQFSIQVYGEMMIRSSTIYSEGSLGYRIYCYPGAVFSSVGSEISDFQGAPGFYTEGDSTEINNSSFQGEEMRINSTDGVTVKETAFFTSLRISNSTQFSLEGVEVTGGGIDISSSGNFSISCQVTDSETGIRLDQCSNGTIMDTTVENCSYGLLFNRSSTIEMINNSIVNNSYDLGIRGTLYHHFLHSIASTDVTSGQVFYLVEESDLSLDHSLNIGYLGMVSCHNITVEDQQLEYNGEGAIAVNSSALHISSSLFAHNEVGLKLLNCTDCLIQGNDFVDNVVHAVDDGSNSFNDTYPQGGNYWDDCSGEDNLSGPHQDQEGGDGIYDTPYYVDEDSIDHYPLLSSTTMPDQDPTANFSYSPESVFSGEELTFTDSSQDPDGYIVNWTWSMGDGHRYYQENVLHVYAEPGNYTVNLTVMDDGRSKDSVHKTIEVKNRDPHSDFKYSPQFPEVGEEVQFSDLSYDEDGTVISWEWTFGDGNTSTAQNPSHAYLEEGSFSVTLEVTDDDGGVSTHSEEVVVGNEFPVPDFSFSPSQPTTGDVVYFEDGSSDPDGSVESWRWEFGDGEVSTMKDPSHRYADNGVYSVTLEVTDNQGASSSCSLDIQVLNVGPTANFTYTPSHPYTIHTIQFNDTSVDPDGEIETWLWDFGDGTNSTQKSPSHRFAEGQYEVSLTVWDDDGTADESTRTVRVENTPPQAGFECPDQVFSNRDVQLLDASHDPDGEIVSWNWSFGDGTWATETDPTHLYSSPGNYTMTLKVTDDDGATSSVSRTIWVKDSPPSASFSWTIDDNKTASTISFQSTSYDEEGGIQSYLWDFGDGNTSTLPAPTHTYDSEGDYEVNLTVTDDNGRPSSVLRTVEVRLPDLKVDVLNNSDSQVEVRVINQGDFGLEGVEVDFIVDGQTVERKELSITGGSNETVVFHWGAEDNQTLSFRVDPDGSVVEVNESNNVASFTASVDDSSLTDIISLAKNNWIVLASLALVLLLAITVKMIVKKK